MNVYGPRIRKARQLAGLTQKELADALGVDVQTVKRKEGSQEPKRLERIAIAEVCGVSLDFIEGRVEDVESAEDAQERRLRELERHLAALRNEISEDLAEIRGAVGNLSAAELQLRRELEALVAEGRPHRRTEGRDRG